MILTTVFTKLLMLYRKINLSNILIVVLIAAEDEACIKNRNHSLIFIQDFQSFIFHKSITLINFLNELENFNQLDFPLTKWQRKKKKNHRKQIVVTDTFFLTALLKDLDAIGLSWYIYNVLKNVYFFIAHKRELMIMLQSLCPKVFKWNPLLQEYFLLSHVRWYEWRKSSK